MAQENIPPAKNATERCVCGRTWAFQVTCRCGLELYLCLSPRCGRQVLQALEAHALDRGMFRCKASPV